MKKILLTLLIFQLTLLSANHYLGGNLRYEFAGFDPISNTNLYRVELDMYIECDNGSGLELADFLFSFYSLDEPLNYGSLTMGSSSFFVMDLTNLSDTIEDNNHLHWITNQENLNLQTTADPCVTLPELCIQKGTYIDTINVPNLNDTVFISNWDISLSQSLTNIELGASGYDPPGLVIYATIPPHNQNSSPDCFEFIEDVNPLLCLGNRQTISYEVTNIGQTTTTYEFVEPLESQFLYVAPMATYSASPIPFIPPYTYDDPFNLGDSIWIDQSTGEISIRPDNLGFYYLDVLIKAYDNNGNLMSSMNRPFSYYVVDCNIVTANPQISTPECGEKTISFDHYVNAGFTYNWNFGDGNTATTANTMHTYANYGTYYCDLIISKGGLCNDTSNFEVTLTPGYKIHLDVDDNTQCIIDNTFEFSLTYTDLDSGLTPESIIYFGNDANLDSSMSTLQSGIIYNQTGIHEVHVFSSTNGCIRKDTIEIEVLPSPIAYFSIDPLIVKIDESIEITNHASHYDSLFYIFQGDTIYSEDFTKTVNHLKEGEYSITQFVKSINNDECVDQKTITFNVLDYFWIKFPNTITPNGDGINEYLFATHRNVKGIKYTIANRWGAIIYQDPTMIEDNKWFGYKTDGTKVNSGVYILIAEYFDYKGKSHQYEGIINVIY